MSVRINICLTCLSSDRRLVSVKKIASLLQEINFIELNGSSGGVCWECKNIMLKAYTLKRKARIAQESLANITEKHQLKSLTSLTTKINILHNYEFTHSLDPLTNCESPKIELQSIKTEIEDHFDDNLDINCEIDEKVLDQNAKNEKVYVETIRTRKKKILLKKNGKRSRIDEKEVREKFAEVVLSEEEMLRNREEKRSHPNFKKIPYKCDSCVLGFTRKETYNLHMEKKHDESSGPHPCDVCHIRFPNPNLLEKHRTKHYVCYKCKLCRYETHELWTAVNHCRLKHGGDEVDRIHCSKCEEVFKTPKDLEEHTQTDHSLFCNECGVKFKGMNSLRRHKTRIHAVKREFKCDICTKTFKTKTRLESHMVTHNSTIAKKLSYCVVCNIQFKNIYVYRNHLKYSANHSEKYPCPECNKKFASKVYWTKHYNFYHLRKSQYNCEICNKLFISDWRLKNHKQKHHGLSRTRDHSCNICGKKFFTLSTLRAHQLTHSAQRSYMCDHCGDTFRQRPALYTHARLLHTPK